MNLTLIEGKASITLTTEQEAQMIHQAAQIYAQTYAAAKAESEALAQVYTIQELAKRLRISLSTTRALITNGEIRYLCIGRKKGYRVTELAVRQYLGDTQ